MSSVRETKVSHYQSKEAFFNACINHNHHDILTLSWITINHISASSLAEC
jgi:hypothetical protein